MVSWSRQSSTSLHEIFLSWVIRASRACTHAVDDVRRHVLELEAVVERIHEQPQVEVPA
jgi:hypothetical protein